jgi:hypothetical protein
MRHHGDGALRAHPEERSMPPQSSKRVQSTFIALPLIALLVVVAWRGLLGAQATAADTDVPAATATRQVELTEIAALRTELARLQTQVAELQPTATATPTPSPTPTPTQVPPAPMNQPLKYQDEWTIVVNGVTKSPTVSGHNESRTAEGVYVQVSLTVTNEGRDQRRFPYQDFVLVDDRGRVFAPTVYESLMVSESIQSFPPSIPTGTGIVFDVTTDVGDTFILESRQDPTFRVQLRIVLRG